MTLGPARQRIEWGPMGNDVTFDVARGQLIGLVAGTPASCIVSGTPNTFHVDFNMPAPGSALYYLVGATNDCGSGSWGPPGQARTSNCP